VATIFVLSTSSKTDLQYGANSRNEHFLNLSKYWYDYGLVIGLHIILFWKSVTFFFSMTFSTNVHIWRWASRNVRIGFHTCSTCMYVKQGINMFSERLGMGLMFKNMCWQVHTRLVLVYMWSLSKSFFFSTYFIQLCSFCWLLDVDRVVVTGSMFFILTESLFHLYLFFVYFCRMNCMALAVV
jgi:hypothetical protein